MLVVIWALAALVLLRLGLFVVFRDRRDSARFRRVAYPDHPHVVPARLLNDESFASEEGVWDGLWWRLLWKGEPKALVVAFHGYGDHSHFLQRSHAYEIASRTGAAVLQFDQPGAGRSRGLWASVPDWQSHVDQCKRFVLGHGLQLVCGKFGPLKVFAFGNSMGGAVALTIAIQQPAFFDGLVLVAPMCKIAKTVRPSAPVEILLRGLARLMPELPATPATEVSELCYRDPTFLQHVYTYNYLQFNGQPRLATAVSLVDASDFIHANMEKVRTPFIVLHGSSDAVTSPDSSRELFERACASDKQLELLEGYFHCLMGAAQDYALCDRPYSLIAQWILSRIDISPTH